MTMENFLIQLLGKLLDKSKAKNPLVWFIVACLIGLAQLVITNSTAWNVTISADWLKALQTLITVGGLLIGSRTTAFLMEDKSKEEQPELMPDESLVLLTNSNELTESLLSPTDALPMRNKGGRPRKPPVA